MNLFSERLCGLTEQVADSSCCNANEWPPCDWCLPSWQLQPWIHLVNSVHAVTEEGLSQEWWKAELL